MHSGCWTIAWLRFDPPLEQPGWWQDAGSLPGEGAWEDAGPHRHNPRSCSLPSIHRLLHSHHGPVVPAWWQIPVGVQGAPRAARPAQLRPPCSVPRSEHTRLQTPEEHIILLPAVNNRHLCEGNPRTHQPVICTRRVALLKQTEGRRNSCCISIPGHHPFPNNAVEFFRG